MTTFDDRTKGFEGKFAHDEALKFKITARRNKLIGLWMAEKLGKSEQEAEQYAKDVIMSDFEKEGDDDVVEKLMADIANSDLTMNEEEIRTEMERFLAIAHEQVMAEKE